MRTDEEKKAERRAQGRRLKAARINQGWLTAVEAAKHYRFGEDTYPQHENGTRGISRVAATYATAYGVPEEWLLRGKNPPAWAMGQDDLPEEDRRGAGEHFLRAWRLYREMTEADFADAMRVPLSVLEGWERGLQDISGKLLSRAAEILDTTPGAILDADPKAIPPSLLELWIETSRRQRQVIDLARQLRTGTAG